MSSKKRKITIKKTREKHTLTQNQIFILLLLAQILTCVFTKFTSDTVLNDLNNSASELSIFINSPKKSTGYYIGYFVGYYGLFNVLPLCVCALYEIKYNRMILFKRPFYLRCFFWLMCLISLNLIYSPTPFYNFLSSKVFELMIILPTVSVLIIWYTEKSISSVPFLEKAIQNNSNFYYYDDERFLMKLNILSKFSFLIGKSRSGLSIAQIREKITCDKSEENFLTSIFETVKTEEKFKPQTESFFYQSNIDELLSAAVEIVLETEQASVSMLQYRLKLGYSRAARLIDQMEELGFVGSFENSRPRQVLITREMWEKEKSSLKFRLSKSDEQMTKLETMNEQI